MVQTPLRASRSRSSVGRAPDPHTLSGGYPEVEAFESLRVLFSSADSSGPSGQGRAPASAGGRVVQTPLRASRSRSSVGIPSLTHIRRWVGARRVRARYWNVEKNRSLCTGRWGELHGKASGVGNSSPSETIWTSDEVETGEGPAPRSVLNGGVHQGPVAQGRAPSSDGGGRSHLLRTIRV